LAAWWAATTTAATSARRRSSFPAYPCEIDQQLVTDQGRLLAKFADDLLADHEIELLRNEAIGQLRQDRPTGARLAQGAGGLAVRACDRPGILEPVGPVAAHPADLAPGSRVADLEEIRILRVPAIRGGQNFLGLVLIAEEADGRREG